MKKFVFSIISFVLLLTFIIFHSVSMISLGQEIEHISKKVIARVQKEEWDEARVKINEIYELWESKSIWTALTMRTDDLEEIEISFLQSKKYAELEDKNKFLGEFIMFSNLVKHIPHQEGFHIEELL